jgi:SAM-dependent methyltransferase
MPVCPVAWFNLTCAARAFCRRVQSSSEFHPQEASMRDDEVNPNRLQPRDLVEAGYDQMAEQYLASKRPLTAEAEALLEQLLESVPADAPLLDLGCGAGVPVTRWLAARRPVTGVDLSSRQLELARQHVPTATFVQADMTAVDFPPSSFGGVVAMHSIIHVPREEHLPLLQRIHRWLRPGGRFLATWPVSAWEGDDPNWLGWGAPMWWSHFDGATNLELLRRAGFAIDVAETRHEQDETWLWVLARSEKEGAEQ